MYLSVSLSIYPSACMPICFLATGIFIYLSLHVAVNNTNFIFIIMASVGLNLLSLNLARTSPEKILPLNKHHYQPNFKQFLSI